MEKDLNNLTKEELILKIKQLQKEKKLNHNKYGLVWDTEKEPEQVVELCKNNIPILKNIKTKDIKTDNSQDNILIEGDNYHALQVLNYTHKNKIDVIYIDPPYNTGNKDFKYNDTFVDKEDGYRHSKWLNFMNRRLELAKTLLKDSGVIFISIDDNEQANLKLLCDKVFGLENFIALISWQNLDTIKNDAKYFSNNNEYILCYAKVKNKLSLRGIKKTEKQKSHYKNYDNDKRGIYLLTPLHAKSGTQSSIYTYTFSNGQKWTPPKGTFPRFSQESLKKLETDNRILLDPKGKKTPQKKTFWNEINLRMPATTFWNYIEYGSTRQSNKELAEILLKGSFQNPKPVKLIYSILDVINNMENSIILDFFAGSGTTGHAVLDLNKQDGGNRKFILCTNNENNICTEVCYPRVRKVIKGYKKNGNGELVEGLGGNLKYFKTDLISVDRIDKITDTKRKELTQKAGEIIGIKEDTLQEIEINNYYQILSNNTKTKFTAIYFRESEIKLEELINKIKNKKTVLYVFSYGKVDRKMYKELSKNISIEDIPQPILDIYKELNLKFED